MAIVALGGALIAAVAAGAAWVSRRRIRARFETAADRTSRGADIIEGAEPVSLNHGDRGVLILHGFGDTPQSVRALATALHANGWTVRAPLLHGHGSSLRAFTEASAQSWLADAGHALDELRTHVTRVVLVGQSMGGALATILASEGHVDALVLLVPFGRLSPRAARFAAFHRVVSLFVPYLRSRSDSSILDPEARSRGLGRGVTTPRLLHELSLIVRHARDSAPSIRVPALVIHSRQDPRVTIGDAEAAFARLGSTEKTLEWATRSGHVLTVDFDRDWVTSQVLGWLEAQVPRA
ncbi:MAG TPA: alpha/beta fold hydrolase [Gemmatimonadaceae bacterium]